MKQFTFLLIFIIGCSYGAGAITPPKEVERQKLTDEELLTLVQKQTFRYFWDFAHSESGLTASDGDKGYSAHSPCNDRGVITPTAAISSIPYTPEYSMEAMRYFYEELGDKLWGEYGFRDAFNLTGNWFAPSYLAIDQGPIIVMIENYRTQLIWKLFMSHPDVQSGLKKLGFTSPYIQ